MVYLILTRRGFDDVRGNLATHRSPVWLNFGLAKDEELADLRAGGVDVSTFTRRIDEQDALAIESAAATVRQHHVNEVIRVEYPGNLGIST